jgi:N-acetylglucosaminyldiphosphoundecaprenol N-acetyl-beta-D-mannosaminyltransferase
VRFQALTREEAAERIARLAGTGARAYVVKPYSEFMPRAAREGHVRDVLNGADLCLPDGAGILWAAHYLSLPGLGLRAVVQLPLSLAAMVLRPSAVRRPLPEAMAGVDLTWRMLERLAESGASVYLLGGTPAEARRAAERVQERLPGLRIAGLRDGYFRQRGAENDAVVEAINAAAPDALLVAMGFPRQELWISENLPRLKVRVAVAEGGSFSFLAGTAARAPRWMRNAGLEWLWRLVRQPSRLRRQLALPVFVWLVFRERRGR